MGDPTRILVAQVARVYLATVGTPAPANATVIMPPAWREVGFFTPDSLSFATDATFEQVRSHQSLFPTRQFQTEESGTVEVDLQEWSADNFQAVYGGGQVVEITPALTPPQYRFTPPKAGGRTSVAACVELIDGEKKYRRMIPRVMQMAGVEQSFSRTAESILPLRLTILGSDLADPFYDLTNDPAFAPVAA